MGKKSWTETRTRLLKLLPGVELPEKWEPRIDLRGANLKGALLYDAHLKGARLTGANLTGANLEGALLTGADLTGANLTGANLYDARLTGADLTSANLAGANLYDARLTGADLYDARLTGANLAGAQDIFGFTLGKHFGFFQPSSGYCWIGCVGMCLSDWLEQYEDIGRKSGYSEAEIARYGAMLRLCAEWDRTGR